MKKILIVEDTDSIRRLLAAALRNRGHDVLEAADGNKGWSLARRELPDLIILDVMLPGRDGFEICSDLKDDPRRGGIPIIMVTGIASDSGKADAVWQDRSRADDFISKPFRLSELIDRSEDLLYGRRQPCGSEMSEAMDWMAK